MKSHFFHFYPGSMDPCSMVKTVYENARRSWLCSGCAYPRPEFKEIDVTIQDATPKSPLTFVNGCGIPIAQKECLFSLGAEIVTRDFYIGRVFGRNNELLADWVTYRGRNRLIVRGSKNVSFRKCLECGRSVYFAMGGRYLCPGPDNPNRLYESDLLGLIVPEHLRECLQSREWRGISCSKLCILEKPKDGLPCLL